MTMTSRACNVSANSKVNEGFLLRMAPQKGLALALACEGRLERSHRVARRVGDPAFVSSLGRRGVRWSNHRLGGGVRSHVR